MGYLGYKPADKPLTSADITDSIITSAKITDATIVNGDIANSTIALAKLSATGTADATTFLRGDNSWQTAGGTNTPSFSVYTTSSTNLGSAGSVNKIKCDTELYDTDNAYNTTTYEFTVPTGKGGKYCFLMNVNNYEVGNTDINYVYTYIYKNGSNQLFNANNHTASTGTYKVGILNTVLDLSAGDIIAFYSRIGASGTHYSEGGLAYTRISGFKLL